MGSGRCHAGYDHRFLRRDSLDEKTYRSPAPDLATRETDPAGSSLVTDLFGDPFGDDEEDVDPDGHYNQDGVERD